MPRSRASEKCVPKREFGNEETRRTVRFWVRRRRIPLLRPDGSRRCRSVSSTAGFPNGGVPVRVLTPGRRSVREGLPQVRRPAPGLRPRLLPGLPPRDVRSLLLQAALRVSFLTHARFWQRPTGCLSQEPVARDTRRKTTDSGAAEWRRPNSGAGSRVFRVSDNTVIGSPEHYRGPVSAERATCGIRPRQHGRPESQPPA
jgi:hypothetical protein